MSKKIDDKIFNMLLYVSRIEVSKEEGVLLQKQISDIVGYFAELETFRDDKLSFFDTYNTEDDLRIVDSRCYITVYKTCLAYMKERI